MCCFFFPDAVYVLDTPTVVGIAFAAFVIGALLTGALWFIYSHTGRFSTCCSLIPSQTWLLWQAKMERNALPAGVAKHPAAKRPCFQITYWVFYCKYILLVSSKSSSLSCLWMFWKAVGWSTNILSTMAGDELEIPPVEFSGIHRKRYTISPLDAKNFPFAPVCWSRLTFQRMCALSSLFSSHYTRFSFRPRYLNGGPRSHWPCML